MYANTYARPARRRTAAFTLMEIILVVVIIGIMLTLVAPRITGRTEKARETAARNQINAFRTALQRYEMDIGHFPENLQALVERPSNVNEEDWDGPYLTSNVLPPDPWGGQYNYKSPGEHYKDYDIWSDGPDRQASTEDDITSWAQEGA
jgi:general secretion pathway protein G